MHFSSKGSEVQLQGLGTSLSWGQPQWYHLGENRRLHAELGYLRPWPGLGKWVAKCPERGDQ